MIATLAFNELILEAKFGDDPIVRLVENTRGEVYFQEKYDMQTSRPEFI